MRVQTDVSTKLPKLPLIALFQRPACPRCGEGMFAATAVEYVAPDRMRHSWSCESCGHEFRTATQMPSHLR